MDDFSFGNVWGDDSSPQPPPSNPLPAATALEPPLAASPADDFDAFDPFPAQGASGNTAPAVVASFGDDDDFGDFGDFGDAPVQAEDLGGFADDDGFGDSNAFASTSFTPPKPQKDWQPLRLNPLPSFQDLTRQVDELLEPLWDQRLAGVTWSGEGIRDVEGLSQILVTSER